MCVCGVRREAQHGNHERHEPHENGTVQDHEGEVEKKGRGSRKEAQAQESQKGGGSQITDLIN
jgi:hypothetical protein